MSTQSSEVKVLVIDDDEEIRYSLERVLSGRGYRVVAASSGEAGLEVAQKESPDVILLDIRMGGMSGLETLQHLRGQDRRFMIILMTAYGTTQTAIEAMKFGAFDYVIKPFDVKRILALVESAAEAARDLRGGGGRAAGTLINSEDYKEGLVGSSEPMQEVLKAVGQVAASEVTVLITGESGTGKELVARCLFQHSHRSDKPFMAVNCAAIPDNLIESELFGHEKGAFTGATGQRLGKFELCDGGTIFLDEIGDMALTTQTKILRAIQSGEIQRVGGAGTLRVDVRLLAATNKNLEKMVEEGTFREDLYYRLNVVRLRLPALRERAGDIPQLVDFMLQRLALRERMSRKAVSPEALAVLCRHRWPGNVRELENVIHRSAVVAKGDTILVKDLPLEVVAGSRPAAEPPQPVPPSPQPQERPAAPVLPPPREEAPVEVLGLPPSAPPALTLETALDAVYGFLRKEGDRLLLQAVEREIIRRALRETGGNQVKTSALLGITRATLRKRIEEFGLKC